MKNYDKQRDIDTEVYSQTIYDEGQLTLQSQLEVCEEAIAYLEDCKYFLSNAKDKVKELNMYSNIIDLQTMINDIDNYIIELEWRKEEQ